MAADSAGVGSDARAAFLWPVLHREGRGREGKWEGKRGREATRGGGCGSGSMKVYRDRRQVEERAIWR